MRAVSTGPLPNATETVTNTSTTNSSSAEESAEDSRYIYHSLCVDEEVYQHDAASVQGPIRPVHPSNATLETALGFIALLRF